MPHIQSQGHAIVPVLNTQNIQQAPQDPLYSLVTAYEADTDLNKVDLGVGAYRDETARPWILPVVRKADERYRLDPNLNHEYIPIAGLPEFCTAAQALILGSDSRAIQEKRVVLPMKMALASTHAM
ncbi:Aspartate aminotransferase, cytoplasmic [Didymosphaeria variabile]|uniref:Aspartate aminotransferase, cytoplasmic n=1 Tax=Didymosphaeria variabile TaxID=1932322 RepID=A0A9W8XJG0_9PLEO|nr:Aspartate aminotransferase, cytoplasmic [Didymosphaeria variabile]KAJ4352408.1 Aspartate aminotransferase, cytoplasmic [Didymosphaeria variabile]